MRATLATLVLSVILGSCTDDSGSDPPPGADAPAGQSADANASGGADAAGQPSPDSSTSNDPPCAAPGAMGNEEGVGKYCTAGGNECQGNGSATLCTIDYEAGAPPFCTKICFSPSD